MSEKYRTILTLQCRMTERVAAKCASGGAAGESRAQLLPAQAKLPHHCLRTHNGRGRLWKDKNAQHLPRPCGGANVCCGDTEGAGLTVMSGRRER